jgi:dihydroorotate dehydrogenase (NAD+) catalytic subunit
VALRCAWECARSVAIPVIGCGGIQARRDALEYLVAGCRAVQVGTAAFADPALPGASRARCGRCSRPRASRVARAVGTIHDGREQHAGAAAR